MPYTPPLGSAVLFGTYSPDFPRPYNGLGFKFGGGYSPLAGKSLLANFPSSVADYIPPAGGAANFTALGTSTWVANGTVAVSFTAEGHAEYHTPSGIAHGDVAVSFTANGQAKHGVKGSGTASVSITGTGYAGHGIAGQGAASVSFSAAGVGRVARYELTGEVRYRGVLVNRTVRAYRRDTGALVGEQVTEAGKFKMHAGFEAREHYIIPVDLADIADDFAPPCANRVTSILAVDA
jgi:hypothetical protein